MKNVIALPPVIARSTSVWIEAGKVVPYNNDVRTVTAFGHSAATARSASNFISP